MKAKAIRVAQNSRRRGKGLVLLSAAGLVLLASVAGAASVVGTTTATVVGTTTATVDARYRVESNPVTVDLCPQGLSIIIR